MWNYYQETNDGVSFTSGISGGGYAAPHFMNSDQLGAYLDRTAVYLEESGLRVVRFNGLSGPWDSTYAAAYYDHLKDSGFLGTIVGFRDASPFGTTLEFLGRPAPAVRPILNVNGQTVDQVLETVLASDPQRIFMEFSAPPNLPEITQVADDSATAGNAMLVSPDYFSAESCCLAFDSGAMTLLPGAYEVTVRLKVTDNTSSNMVASVYAGAGFETPEPRYLGSLNINGTDFTEVDRYEEFTYEIELDDLLPNVRFRLDYGDGSTPVYADYAVAQNTVQLNFPVLAPLYMNLGIHPDFFEGMERVPSRFAGPFEEAGGVVLTPDEFLASLNPIYMIDLARRRLGDANEAVVEAQTLLDQGEYFWSLNTIRGALKAVVRIEDEVPVARGIDLLTSYPNPFTSETTITLQVAEAGVAMLTIHDILGRRIRTLADEELTPGLHRFHWDGTSAASVPVAGGVYFVRVRMPNERVVHKVVRAR